MNYGRKLAEIVDDAARNARSIPQLSENGWDLTLEQAYEVQRYSVDRRQGRGEKPAGVKLGFTSRAKMVQMGLSELIWGRLTDGMAVAEGGEIDLADYVHPRAEPEIAFLMKRSLAGQVSLAEAMAAVEAVMPAVEIIDSRYENFKFNLSDVVADNTSSSGFVLGNPYPADTDIANLGMVLEFEGIPVQIGSSAAVLGHPARALVAAARLLTEHEMELEPGWVVMSGGATAAEALSKGVSVRCVVQGMGGAAFSVKK